MPTTRQKKIYNQRTYMTHLYRLRVDSDLADRVGAYKADGHSLTQLISELLAGYFGVPLPMKIYTVVTVLKGDEKEMELVTDECPNCFRAYHEAGDKAYAMPDGLTVCMDCIEEYAVVL